MTGTMPLDVRTVEAFRLLAAVESLQRAELGQPLQIVYHPGEDLPFQVGRHRGDCLAAALELALRAWSGEAGDSESSPE